MTIINKLRKKFPGIWTWEPAGQWWAFEDGRHVVEEGQIHRGKLKSYPKRRFCWTGSALGDYFTL